MTIYRIYIQDPARQKKVGGNEIWEANLRYCCNVQARDGAAAIKAGKQYTRFPIVEAAGVMQ